MPEWLTDASVAVALIVAFAGLLQQMINNSGKKAEVAASSDDNLIKNMGAQLDRLEKAQRQDRARIDWLEDELWTERKVRHEMTNALSQTVDWGEDVMEWIGSGRVDTPPHALDWGKFRKLLETPLPRRPPPVVDD